MAVFGSVASLVLALIGWKTEKKLFNPLTIFCFLWGIILFLSSLQLWGLGQATFTTYSWIILGVFMFALGYFVIKLAVGEKAIVLGNIGKSYGNTFVLNYRLLYVILVLCILFALKDFVSIVSAVGFGSSLSTIQKLLQSDEEVFVRSPWENVMRLFIVNPMFWIAGPIMVVDFWVGKRDKLLMILTLSLLALRLFTTGGRAALIQLAFCFICVYTLAKVNEKSTLLSRFKITLTKNKRLFGLILMAAVLLLAAATLSRAGQAAVRTIYYDFAMQPKMLEIWATIADNTAVGLGRASLNGFLYPVDYVLRNTLHISLSSTYQSIYELIMATDSEWQWIGPTVRANAYVTAFWFFYVDARVFGIAAGCFIYGGFCRLSYRKMRWKISPKSMAVYSLILLGVFYTFGRFEFSQDSYILGIIYLSLCLYKKEYSTVPISQNT